MFCLCITCVLTSSSKECGHTEDKESVLTGAWVMDEVMLAVEKGYRILDIYMRFMSISSPNTTPKQAMGDFSSSTFFKLKAEASGYPGWVHSPNDEKRYVESFWTSEGIRLEKEGNRYNAAKGVWPNCVSIPCGGNRRRGTIGL